VDRVDGGLKVTGAARSVTAAIAMTEHVIHGRRFRSRAA